MPTRQRRFALRAVRRNVLRRFLLLEIGDVVAGPLAFLLVPPEVFLTLAPRPSERIGRGAVVKQPAVCGPSPSPLRRDPALPVSGLAICGLIRLVFENAAIDPAAAGGGAVGLELRIPGNRASLRVPTADLA